MSVLTSPHITAWFNPASAAPRSTFDLSLQGHTVVATLKNRDGKDLTVHARSFTLGDTPAQHVVPAAREITAAWQATPGYDLSLHAEHGTYRQIEGRVGEPQVEARLRCKDDQISVWLFNPHRESMHLEVTEAGRTRTVKLRGFGHRRITLGTSGGAYEVLLAVRGTHSRQVLAGHL